MTARRNSISQNVDIFKKLVQPKYSFYREV